MKNKYDVVIIGAGLGGLTLAIQLAKQGYKVCVCEKNTFPFHKVCGEYISLESVNFLKQCGFDIKSEKDIPIIDQLSVSARNGSVFSTALPLGGFGVSRYFIDQKLADHARNLGVTILDGLRVDEITNERENFIIKIRDKVIESRVVAGAYGKRSNLDIHLDRGFIKKKPTKEELYVGVKYHIRYDAPKDTIFLHNFKDGYCGMSRIEGDKYCLCYMTNAKNLERHGSIQKMEQDVLMKNKYLKDIFTRAEFLWEQPKTIAQISFAKKELIHQNILMLGDAAGMIPPLCGNGMSMAMHGSKMLSELLPQYLDDKIDYASLCELYTQQWHSEFATRLAVGRWLQSLFGREQATTLLIALAKFFPYWAKKLINKTHGKSF
jgi:flavin-dependent dehydrogenase